ncbi:hypothetical protein SDC9_164352 [bioreactor metagenome]|uniref:Uncharacterized protein n=2 Tax=root TaxID=1 RepID=A0A645FYL7_9ZZZZ
MLKVPAIPGLMGGALIGVIIAVFFQGQDMGAILEAATNGYASATGVESVDMLLSNRYIKPTDK